MMTRYRTYLMLAGRWHVGDTYAHWPDVQMAMALHERNHLGAICVVVDSAIDRHIRETGRLPPNVRQQVARAGRKLLAERGALGPNTNGGSHE
jgi:hypothetical protein